MIDQDYYSPRPRPTRPRRRPRMSGRVRMTLFAVALVPVLVGAGITAYALTRQAVGPADGKDPAAAVVAAGPIRLRVTDLMRSAGCRGAIIGTQLYSYETGRCKVGSAEITIAVFDTPNLRDRWLVVARSFGGNPVVGDGWAAIAETPETAGILVAKLNGRHA